MKTPPLFADGSCRERRGQGVESESLELFPPGPLSRKRKRVGVDRS